MKLSPARIVSIALTISVVLLAAHNRQLWYQDKTMTTSPSIASLFDKVKSICFGRLLIDVPSTASVIFGPAEAPSRIERLQGQAANASALKQARLREIEVERVVFDRMVEKKGQRSRAGEVASGVRLGHELLVGVSRSSHFIYRVDSFIELGSDLYIQENSAPVYPYPNDTETLDATFLLLNAVALKIRPQEQGEMPIESGVCIDGAFVPDMPELTHERISIGVRLAEFPDVHFSIQAFKAIKRIAEERHQLAERQRRAERAALLSADALQYLRIKFLRRGERTIAGWPAFEVLARRPGESSAGHFHEFVAEAPGQAGNALAPVFEAHLDTGVRGNDAGTSRSSLSDSEAVELWDRLLATVRVRPVPGVKTSESPQHSVPLGTQVASGTECPQAGWWRCLNEASPIEGGRSRLLALGQSMPKIALLEESTRWNRLLGKRRHQVDTVWTLTSYPDPSD